MHFHYIPIKVYGIWHSKQGDKIDFYSLYTYDEMFIYIIWWYSGKIICVSSNFKINEITRNEWEISVGNTIVKQHKI